MGVIMGQQPTKHNYYSAEDFLRYSKETGGLFSFNDQRLVHASEDFILGLQTGLEQEVGDASAVIMYKVGYQWGVADMRRFQMSMQREFSRDVQDMNLQFVMEEWWWPLQSMGWGSWEVDFKSKQDQGLVLINLYDSAVAKTLGEIGKPVCYLYAGLFAGILSTLSRRKLSGIEIQCYAMGASYCRFIVGSEKRINAVEFWLEEGASASDVVAKI